MHALFQNGGFRRLWVSQVVLALGDACLRMGLLEIFLRCQLDREVETAKMFFALALPGLLLGPFAVVHVDRWQRRSLMMASDAVRMLLLGAMVWWLWQATGQDGTPASLGWVSLLIFLIGVIVTFYLPARYALMPNLVAADDLIRANTLLTTSLAVAAVGGMPLGGWLAVRFGPLWAVAANALAYAVSVGLIGSIRMQPHATRDRDKNVAPTTALRDGLRYLGRHPTALPLVLVAGAFAFLAGILIVTIVGYAEKTLELGTLGLGWLGGAAGVGAGLGVVLLGRGQRWTRSIWLPCTQLVVAGAVLGLLSLTTEPGVAVWLLMVVGAVGATAMIPIDAKLQEQVADEWRGAVFAARGTLTSATMIVAFWLKFGTDVLRTTPPPTVLWWCGAGAVVVAGLTFLVLRRRTERAGRPSG